MESIISAKQIGDFDSSKSRIEESSKLKNTPKTTVSPKKETK